MAQVEGSIHRTIAKRIKAIRGDQKLSAAKLAERMTEAGVKWDRSIVANFENGRRSYITVEELVTVARVLDVPPMALLAESGSDPVVELAKYADYLLKKPFDLQISADASGIEIVRRARREATKHIVRTRLAEAREKGRPTMAEVEAAETDYVDVRPSQDEEED